MIISLVALMTMVPLVPYLWLLVVILLVMGIAKSTMDVGGNTLLVWVHGEQVGPFMNGLHFCFGIGSFLSPLIIAQAIARSGSIAWGYWLLAIIILPVAIGLLTLSSPPLPKSKEQGGEAVEKIGLAALVTLFFFFYVGAEVGTGDWIFTYIVKMNLSSETTAAYLTSAFWGALTVGRLLSIPLAIHLRPRTILMSDMVGCLVSCSIMLLWPTSLTAIWIGTMGMGLSMASIFPTTFSFAGRRMTITARITGWFFGGASIGAMILPWLIGQLFEPLGPQVMLWGVFIDVLLMITVFFVLMKYSGSPKEFRF